ncbi:hypothetical protein DAPPUDRAFT_313196 [Daphnia pulex]|uniref:Uncharacterized protein n=1 Tax=Daphnia pulex TaxID=6669 RepID=E9G352_DAPPU|nr:hypothetical protein DAPPUDRAFT_313196 [Daphnia pulex]|eukprot:EFX86392.1 hypothetical protein DAPPUDRAFT_313196 [Daphnia pulex]
MYATPDYYTNAYKTKALKYYTTTYAAPSYYTYVPKYYFYNTTTYATPSYNIAAPKYYTEEAAYYTTTYAALFTTPRNSIITLSGLSSLPSKFVSSHGELLNNLSNYVGQLQKFRFSVQWTCGFGAGRFGNPDSIKLCYWKGWMPSVNSVDEFYRKTIIAPVVVAVEGVVLVLAHFNGYLSRRNQLAKSFNSDLELPVHCRNGVPRVSRCLFLGVRLIPCNSKKYYKRFFKAVGVTLLQPNGERCDEDRLNRCMQHEVAV